MDVKPDSSEKYLFDSSRLSAAFGLMISNPLRGVKATLDAIPFELSRLLWWCPTVERPPAQTDIVPPNAVADMAALLRASFCCNAFEIRAYNQVD